MVCYNYQYRCITAHLPGDLDTFIDPASSGTCEDISGYSDVMHSISYKTEEARFVTAALREYNLNFTLFLGFCPYNDIFTYQFQVIAVRFDKAQN